VGLSRTLRDVGMGVAIEVSRAGRGARPHSSQPSSRGTIA
jgi:hypothetical protein